MTMRMETTPRVRSDETFAPLLGKSCTLMNTISKILHCTWTLSVRPVQPTKVKMSEFELGDHLQNSTRTTTADTNSVFRNLINSDSSRSQRVPNPIPEMHTTPQLQPVVRPTLPIQTPCIPTASMLTPIQVLFPRQSAGPLPLYNRESQADALTNAQTQWRAMFQRRQVLPQPPELRARPMIMTDLNQCTNIALGDTLQEKPAEITS